MKINNIPIGRENRKSGLELCEELGIGKTELRIELAKLKEDYIILCDDGYYRPTKVEEYDSFIENLQKIKCNVNKTIKIALKERKVKKIKE